MRDLENIGGVTKNAGFHRPAFMRLIKVLKILVNTVHTDCTIWGVISYEQKTRSTGIREYRIFSSSNLITSDQGGETNFAASLFGAASTTDCIEGR